MSQRLRPALLLTFAAVVIILAAALPSRAADLYAAPSGAAGAAGTQMAPLDLASAVGPKSPVQPGDTLWLEPGVYSYPLTPITQTNGDLGYGYQVSLAGTAATPITMQGIGHVTIDGGLALVPPSTHLVVRDLEITTLQPRPAGSFPDSGYNFPFAYGGLNVFSGDGDKFIDLDIHNNCQGISLWQGATNSEVEGCVIYGNGWVAPSGGGHEIYTQNIAATGTKLFDGNIIGSGLSGYALHAYGQGGHVENLTFDHNVFEPGPGGGTANELIGGNLPSSGIAVTNNDVYHESLLLGWYAPYNADLLFAGNDVMQDHNEVDIKNYVNLSISNNTIVGWGANIVRAAFTPPLGSTPAITGAGNVVTGGGMDFMGYPDGWQPPPALASPTFSTARNQVAAGYIQGGSIGAAPTAPTVHVAVDKYDPDRAIVDVLNWTKAAAVSVDLSSVLQPGDSYKLLNPFDLWGSPVLSGTYIGPITLQPGEFAAYVVERDPVTLDDLAAQLAALTARVSALEAAPAGVVTK